MLLKRWSGMWIVTHLKTSWEISSNGWRLSTRRLSIRYACVVVMVIVWWWCGDNPGLSSRACFVVGGYPTCSSPSREYHNSNRGSWEICVHTSSCYIQTRTHTGDPDTLSCSSSPCWWTYSCWVPIEYLLICWVLTSKFYVHPFPPFLSPHTSLSLLLLSLTVRMWPLSKQQEHSFQNLTIGSQLFATSLGPSTCSSPCGCW